MFVFETIGDESGRIVRVKEPPKMSVCTICQSELKITKTNTELKAHAEGKHGKTCEEVSMLSGRFVVLVLLF